MKKAWKGLDALYVMCADLLPGQCGGIVHLSEQLLWQGLRLRLLPCDLLSKGFYLFPEASHGGLPTK
jgi:hypothetical protein